MKPSEFDSNSEKTEANCTIEHILPLNPEEGQWVNFTLDDIETYSATTANMVLLEKTLNNSVGNAEFAKKKLAYADSLYRSAQEIAHYDHWTAAVIEQRLAQLAKKANTIWQLDGLDRIISSKQK